MEQISFFENKKEKSTDWKWSMTKDYPEKNGLKVFSCFACGGGGVQWGINWLVAMLLVAMKLTQE